MSINELRDYLAKYVGEGKGFADVLICQMSENPLTAKNEIKDIAFLEWQDGDCSVVIQIGSRRAEDGK